MCKKSKRNTQNKETPGNYQIFFSKKKKKTNQEESWANWNGRKGKVLCCLDCAVLVETVLFFVSIEILDFSFSLQIKKKTLIRHEKLAYISLKRKVYLKSTSKQKLILRKQGRHTEPWTKTVLWSSPFLVNRGRRCLQERSEDQYSRSLWKEDSREKQTKMCGYNILKWGKGGKGRKKKR